VFSEKLRKFGRISDDSHVHEIKKKSYNTAVVRNPAMTLFQGKRFPLPDTPSRTPVVM